MEKPLLTFQEVRYEFNLGEKFIEVWTAPEACRDYKAGKSKIPGMPVIRPGEKGMLFPRELLMQWLLRYFGSGYGTEETGKGGHLAGKGAGV